ncbi:porin [Alphaproteobacteria bacterium]|nr:porin [Alphaproteobacteria bacterium]
MRKLLLGTTALVASGALLANAAVADVSISAATEWSYSSRSSNVTANDGTTFGTDSEIKFSFTNKTDSGLTIGYDVELESDATTAGGADNMVDESSLSISGGFGKIVLGMNDSVGDNYGVASTDLPSEESSPSVTSASIGTSTDISGMEGDANKISYHLPAMGGLTVGASFTDSGAVGSTDTTTFGFNYAMDAGGTAVTIGGATATTEATTTDTDAQNLGVKIVSGNLSFIASQSHLETVDDDIESTGVAVSYKMANGMVLVAHTMKSEDDLEAGEEYTKSGVELQYVVAAGLTAVINVDDYEYTAATTPNASGTATSDSGTVSKLTLKASF